MSRLVENRALVMSATKMLRQLYAAAMSNTPEPQPTTLIMELTATAELTLGEGPAAPPGDQS